MAKRSVFRKFIKELKREWRSTFPSIRPLETRLHEFLPKASTFHTGQAQPSGLQVFLAFQHSPKAWEVDRFTINVVLSERMGAPEDWNGSGALGDIPMSEGSYRIGFLVGKTDKWWHLSDEKSFWIDESGDDWSLDLPFPDDVAPRSGWEPASYDDSEAVIREAVADVSRDVGVVLCKLNITSESKNSATLDS